MTYMIHVSYVCTRSENVSTIVNLHSGFNTQLTCVRISTRRDCGITHKLPHDSHSAKIALVLQFAAIEFQRANGEV